VPVRVVPPPPVPVPVPVNPVPVNPAPVNPAPVDVPPQGPPAPVPVEPQVRPYEPAPTETHHGNYYWHPADDSGVRLSPPIPYVEDEESPQAEKPQPRQPRAAEKPKVREERSAPQEEPQPPRTREERDTASTLPVGIAQFALAWERVAAGLKPTIDGLDWLRDKGYRTVLHLRAPGEDDSADRKQVSKRGLKYVSLEVAPQTLSKDVLDEFSRLVTEAQGYPLFVYDRDGMVAGGLWYLYFRTVEKDTDDAARVKAARLGLGENTGGEHKAMWLAIQKYLSENKS
jgi:protein tyrosine phosphatase (PTP) superfamily phosphohydrolase (DUF442 family)